MDAKLRRVAESVIRRAQQQGFVVPAEVREELARAGLDEEQWEDVLALARPVLRMRHGRYYYVSAASAGLLEEERQRRAIHHAVRHLLRQYRQKTAEPGDRRGHNRVVFIQPVQIETETQPRQTVLTRDLSLTGIRLIGPRSLLGQKIRVFIPGDEGEDDVYRFLVRVVWASRIGEELYENGGLFLEVGD